MMKHDHRVAGCRHLHLDAPFCSVRPVERAHAFRHSHSSCRGKRPPSGESGILLVPILYALFAKLPAQKNRPAVDLSGKIHQSGIEPLHLHAELPDLGHVSIYLARELLRFNLEPVSMFVRLTDDPVRRNFLEFANLFLPAPVVAHQVADDATDEGKCSVRVLYSETCTHARTVGSGSVAVKPWSGLRQRRGLCRPFLEPPPASSVGCLVPPDLFLRFGHELGYLDRPAIPVHCDECQVAGIRVSPDARLKILRFDTDADFHRSAPDEIHAALHYHEVAEVYRLA